MYLKCLAKCGLLIYALIPLYPGLTPPLWTVFYLFLKCLSGSGVGGITYGAVGWGSFTILGWGSRPLEVSQPSYLSFQLLRLPVFSLWIVSGWRIPWNWQDRGFKARKPQVTGANCINLPRPSIPAGPILHHVQRQKSVTVVPYAYTCISSPDCTFYCHINQLISKSLLLGLLETQICDKDQWTLSLVFITLTFKHS